MNEELMDTYLDAFKRAIEEGNAVATRPESSGHVVGVMPVESGRHALVIELGARAAYDLIFGYDGPTVEAR